MPTSETPTLGKALLLLLPIKRLFLPAVAILGVIALMPQFISQDSTTSKKIEWIKMPGAALDIDISMEGDAWIASKDGAVKKWEGSKWLNLGGSAERIAAGPANNTWVINAQNEVFRWNFGNWLLMPGKATDIAIGASGAIWMISTEKVAGGYRVFKWGNVDWVAQDSAGVRIAVGPKGNPWIVNDRNEIYRLTRQIWKKAPDLARDIAISANGVSWILDPPAKPGEDSSISSWGGKTWVPRYGALSAIATDARAYPWGINAQNEIFADARSIALKRE